MAALACLASMKLPRLIKSISVCNWDGLAVDDGVENHR